MATPLVSLDLDRATQLSDFWLDGFPGGGLFVPGTPTVSAGENIAVLIRTTEPRTTTLVSGMVVWRRLPPKGPGLPAGIGVLFDESMRARTHFLRELAAGATADGRRSLRYPSEEPCQLVIPCSQNACNAKLLDVAVWGARLKLQQSAILNKLEPIQLRLANANATRSLPLAGTVAWFDRRVWSVGIRLALTTADERLQWARVVNTARSHLAEAV